MKTIRGKLLFSMSAAMLATIAITILLFIHLIDDLILNQAKAQLHQQVPRALEILNDGDLKDLDRTSFKYIVRDVMFDADYLVFDKNHRIIAASDIKEEGTVFHFKSQDGEGTSSLQGTKIIYAQAKLKNTPYRILIYSPLSSVRALAGSILKTTLMAIGASFAVILCIGLLTVSQIVKPLNRLKEKVSVYEPSHPAISSFPIDEKGEIGELSHTFQLMADRISSHHHKQIEFLQNVSHELKTPLMSINGYVYAIRDGVVSQENGLQVITSQSRRLVEMVDKLLLLSKLEALEEAWPEEELNVHDLVQEAIDLMTPAVVERNLSLQLAGHNFEIKTTGEQLFRILLNLLQNAVRHTNSKIVVTTEHTTEGWMLHVDDDGPGLAESERTEVFERFVTGANGVTGLGLAISLQISRHLGGELVYSDSPLGGARFSFIQPHR